jgi:hypothetical protein
MGQTPFKTKSAETFTVDQLPSGFKAWRQLTQAAVAPSSLRALTTFYRMQIKEGA